MDLALVDLELHVLVLCSLDGLRYRYWTRAGDDNTIDIHSYCYASSSPTLPVLLCERASLDRS